jgi:hypothetical protein
MFVILNGWNGEENFEMFLKCGPQGSCSAAIMNALSVLFSYARRSGVPLIAIARLYLRHGGFCGKAGASGKKPCITALGELLNTLAVEDDGGMAGMPVTMNGSFRTRFTGCGPMMIFTAEDSTNALRYVHVKLAKTNTCAHTITSVVSELISLMLEYGVAPEQIVKGIIDIRCPIERDGNKSCIDGIARAIADFRGNQNYAMDIRPDPPETETDRMNYH